jgi:mannose-1-phosphate guanylyltransferase/mannose-6-phosphate isomerase
MSQIYPVLLSGGAGTRLWPLSRAMYPKQLIRSLLGQGPCLLAATLQRTGSEPGFAKPIIVCNSDHRFLVEEEANLAGVAPRAIVLEPVARNTAPAITAAALLVSAEDRKGILLVMPSDHVIDDRASLLAAVRRAGEVAATGKLVLFGIKPNAPHTGYGYIRRGPPLAGFANVFEVEAFAEKPNRALAADYLAAGNYLWNSGMFVLNVATYLEELSRLAPGLLEAVAAAVAGAKTDLAFLRLEAEAFAKAPNISVDYAVMEKTGAAVVMPADFGWSDVGSWSSLWDLAQRDAHGNAVLGDTLLEDTVNCYVRSERTLISTIGVKDLVIVDTPDALLVADRAKAQEVGGLVAKLKAAKRKEHEQHVRNYRPWGYFASLNVGPRFQVKLLHIKPGAKLSMQMHHHRSEHWVVVQGTAKVVIGTEERLVRENESVYIVATQWHRLENPGKTPLELIEVQIGSYLGEDDIVRADDIYNRAADETR